MYNTKFIMVDGKDLYSEYLGREQRALIREQYRGKKEYMRCACRPDAGLYYKFSEDLKIYHIRLAAGKVFLPMEFHQHAAGAILTADFIGSEYN
ncbi:MAG: hypothetical protein K2M91_04635 [Lachnospiraceae bacterium]|nr:hypothetical protein [Lachnospiraceae bacterium]